MTPFEIFLSHNNLDRADVIALEVELRRRGVLSWRDRKDLRLGEITDDAIRLAIQRETDAFALYATAGLLGSRYVWEVEWPPAHARHEAERLAGRAAPYPIVPLFVGSTNPANVEAAASTFQVPSPLFANGEHLDPTDPASRRTIARLLLRTALLRRDGPGPVRLHLTTFGVPANLEADLVIDWTHELGSADVPWDELREASRDLVSELVVTQRPVEISSSSRLTAGFMLGHALPAKTGISVEVKDWPASGGDSSGIALVERETEGGDPTIAVIEISLARQVGGAAREAIERVGLRPSRWFSISRSEPNVALDPTVAAAATVALGRWLKELRDEGVLETHLFLATPGPVATLLGTAVSSGPAITLYHTVDAAYVRTYRLPA